MVELADAAKKHSEVKDEHQSIARLTSPPFFKKRMALANIIFPGSKGFRTRRIGFNTFVKAGRNVDLHEAETLRFVAGHTSIPVPKVQRVWRSDDVTYILMDFVPGLELEHAWHNMSAMTKRRVIDQLRGYLAQLRALQPQTEGLVASVNGGYLRDIARVGLQPFGPFESHEALHQFLRCDVPLDSFGTLNESDKAIASHRQKYTTKFSHGDFTPRNILVKKDGTVTAVVDWDCAGWYPEYWEFTKANFNPYALDDWVSSIGEMTGQYDEQLAGERQLYHLCGYMLT